MDFGSCVLSAVCAMMSALPPQEDAAARTGDQSERIVAGRWRAELVSPGRAVPFGLTLAVDGKRLSAWLHNGSEKIAVHAASREGDALLLDFSPYESRIQARWVAVDRLEGTWRKAVGDGQMREMRFVAQAKKKGRFAALPAPQEPPARLFQPRGRWRVRFEKAPENSVGIFKVRGVTASGTFLTALGDYRYLAGRFEHNVLRLSCFDGAHAFLFRATMTGADRMRGDFWSGATWHESWTAVRDARAKLSGAFARTAWKKGAQWQALRYPDETGAVRSLADPAFHGAAHALVLLGTWCPNCKDATRLWTELDGRYRSKGLRVLGLAFEHSKSKAARAAQVAEYRQRLQVPYPILIAGPSDKAKATKAFPVLDRVRAYPTTIFLDAAGRVRGVHTGFDGPATGKEHARMRRRFVELIEAMLADAKSGKVQPPAKPAGRKMPSKPRPVTKSRPVTSQPVK